MAPKRTRSAGLQTEAPPKRRRTRQAITASPEPTREEELKSAEPEEVRPKKSDEAQGDHKWKAWFKYEDTSPYPDFPHPTPEACENAHRTLTTLHAEAVQTEFNDPDTPETIPHVLDAMVVAILSQATGWSNAKRAMNSMKETYGSIFAYPAILAGGRAKLQETIKCGGLHVRKSMIITTLLEDVQARHHGAWDLDYLFHKSDTEAMKELLSYKYMGPKSASVVLSWCLKRRTFTVDVHVHRLAGLWGWRPAKATKEMTQSHLNARIPKELQFDLHFLMIAHGRVCPACRGGAKAGAVCLLQGKGKEKEKEEKERK